MPTPTSLTLYPERIGPCSCQSEGFAGPGGPVLGQEKLDPSVPGGPQNPVLCTLPSMVLTSSSDTPESSGRGSGDSEWPGQS